MLETDGVIGLLQRMVALGIVAIGQTFAILAGSIDLSVANLISVAAVLASFIMQGRPEMMLPAVAAGARDLGAGRRGQRRADRAASGQSAHRDARRRAHSAGPAVGELHQFRRIGAEGVPGASPTARSAPCPIRSIGLFALAALASLVLRATRFGAHLYAVGGNAEGARLAGIRTDLVTIGAHVVCSVSAGLTGLYLASRLRSGAPWVGRDGVYDLESIAVVVIGGTLLAGGRGGVWGTLAGVLLFAVARRLVQHARRLGLSEARAARRDRHRGGRRLHVPLAGPRRMTVALDRTGERPRAVALVRRINLAVVVFLVFYLAVGLLQPNYLEPAGVMNFLRRAAPLAILASGQLFVLVSGGFDLSVGSLVTLTVIGGSMLTANDPSQDLVGDRRPLRDRPRRRAHQRRGRRLSANARRSSRRSGRCSRSTASR